MRNNIEQIGGDVWINGKKVVRCPGVKDGKNIISVVKNDHVYINGYEYFKDGNYWKRTIRAFWECLKAVL